MVGVVWRKVGHVFGMVLGKVGHTVGMAQQRVRGKVGGVVGLRVWRIGESFRCSVGTWSWQNIGQCAVTSDWYVVDENDIECR